MLLELENGEVQILNRHYKKGFIEYLGLSKERLGGNHEDD